MTNKIQWNRPPTFLLQFSTVSSEGGSFVSSGSMAVCWKMDIDLVGTSDPWVSTPFLYLMMPV